MVIYGFFLFGGFLLLIFNTEPADILKGIGYIVICGIGIWLGFLILGYRVVDTVHQERIPDAVHQVDGTTHVYIDDKAYKYTDYNDVSNITDSTTFILEFNVKANGDSVLVSDKPIPKY